MNETKESSTTSEGAFQQLGTIVYREQIASTAVGAVYRGYDRADGQPVVLKIGDSRGSELRLDGSIIPQLAHPGIVRIRDAGATPEGAPALVQETRRGRLLIDAASSYDGRYRQIAHFIRETALILDHVHALGVTCGDLSPRTIYVGEDDLPALCEIGMGLVTPASKHVADRARAGADTAEARERKFKLDERADVFALGAVLYFLLTGEYPTDKPVALMSDPHAPLDDLPSIDVAAPEAPTELRAICAQALATDPVHRYLHARDVVRDLEAYLYGKRGRPAVKVAFVLVGAALVALFGLWGTVGGGPARIVQARVLVHRAGAPAGEVSPLVAAERALGLGDYFNVQVRLSKRGYVSIFYRDPMGTVSSLYQADANAKPEAVFALPASVAAPEAWWHPPSPGGVGLVIVVSHAAPRLPDQLVAGVLAGMEDPPRSYAALRLRGRSIAYDAHAEQWPALNDQAGRSRKTWATYADQIIKLLDGRCDDTVVGLMYVMGV